jgi:putative Ca2+/H+ antiporter (TMEM165/GDT1 family)
MQAFLVATGTIALAEIGDKTQLLALLLATRFRNPWPIVAGIVVATLANHLLAALAGLWLGRWLQPQWLRGLLGLGFLAMAAWSLKPDKADEQSDRGHWGAFLATAVAFFLAEIGDKTQVATLMLGARFGTLWPVVAGTTLGMLIADVPAVFLGQRITRWATLGTIRYAAAALFVLLGVATLLGAGRALGL